MPQSSRTGKGDDLPKNQHWKDPEPIVVGDQQGIVVVWADHPPSRFFWPDLRRACSCALCSQKRATLLRTILRREVTLQGDAKKRVIDNAKRKEGRKGKVTRGKTFSQATHS